MKKRERVLSVVTLVAAAALLIALVAVVPHAAAGDPMKKDDNLVNTHKFPCGDYSYTSCPRGCYAQCVPSGCHETSDGHVACTADCDGPGSCVGPTDM